MFTLNMKKLPYHAALGCALTFGFAFSASCAVEAADADSRMQEQSEFRSVKAHAEGGDARAQYLLSTLYRTGNGVKQSNDNAFFWCKQAAEEGVLEAQFQLGVMYLRGEGVAENEDEAMKWLWMAADRGYPQATEVLEYVLYNADFTVGC